MTRPIVHIGYHKTATTWFQNSVYPRAVSHRVNNRELVRSIFVNRDAFEFDADQARDLLGIAPEALPVLICEEELCGVMHIGTAATYIAKEVARRLHATLPDAHIVIFVRSQVDAAASWYLQYLKEGGTASARRYLFLEQYVFPGRYMHKRGNFDFSQLDYSRLVATYDRLFGSEQVHVFPYEELVRNRAGLIETMRSRVGLELGSAELPSKPVNRSLRRGLVPMARLLNAFTSRGPANKRTLLHIPGCARLSRNLLKQLNRAPIFGSKPDTASLIGPEVAAWIGKHFAESNRRLAERMNWDLGALGYDISPLPQSPPAPSRPAMVRWMRK